MSEGVQCLTWSFSWLLGWSSSWPEASASAAGGAPNWLRPPEDSPRSHGPFGHLRARPGPACIFGRACRASGRLLVVHRVLGLAFSPSPLPWPRDSEPLSLTATSASSWSNTWLLFRVCQAPDNAKQALGARPLPAGLQTAPIEHPRLSQAF